MSARNFHDHANSDPLSNTVGTFLASAFGDIFLQGMSVLFRMFSCTSQKTSIHTLIILFA